MRVGHIPSECDPHVERTPALAGRCVPPQSRPASNDELLVVPGTEVVHGLTSFHSAHGWWAVIVGRGGPER
jgi:hypothetical protein